MVSITEGGKPFGQRRGAASDVENFVPAAESVEGAQLGRQPSPPGLLVSHGFETTGGQLPRSCVLQAYADQRFAIVGHGCYFDGKQISKTKQAKRA